MNIITNKAIYIKVGKGLADITEAFALSSLCLTRGCEKCSYSFSLAPRGGYAWDSETSRIAFFTASCTKII